ncbi:MAG: acyltransferase [Acetobacteraceae bacterium]|nr:acyltransferase [Acetobacteraceae bacterium]MBV8520974.1 acyltransferase [Acetobacteraceae bacterium]MBV8588841.1 acyltransferase [Acetobacteraceae bacterium]
MSRAAELGAARIVKAVHGRQQVAADPAFEADLAQELSRNCDPREVLTYFRRFSRGEDFIDALMRRVCLRALARRCGQGLKVAPGVGVRHPETFEIGDGVFIGEQAVIQGRFDGCCKIGNKVWIGPQSFLDARDLVLGDEVGWGPGAKVLGSEHTGLPVDLPIIATDLRVAPVRVEAEADIGVNAVLLPGVTVGRGAIVGAGSIVTRDVPPYTKVAGVPARVIGERAASDESKSVRNQVGVLG